MQATPPETTEKRGVAADATAPASTSPSRGPLATTRLKTDDIRPRMWSGVTDCEIVERQTALTLSAAPATANRMHAGTIEVISPAAAMAMPHTATDPSTIRPSQRACSSQPVVSAATVAPAETDASRKPVPLAPAWKTLSDSTGNSARGIPNVIAQRSITKLPTSACERRTNDSPVRIERSTGSCSATPNGGWGDIAHAARAIPPHVAASMAYTQSTPSAAISRPPSAGPTTIVSWYSPKVSDSAERSRSGATVFGTIAARVTRSTDDAPASAPAST